MNNAEVGDDVYQEDPTVNQLEELAANKSNFRDGFPYILLRSGWYVGSSRSDTLVDCRR